MLKEESRPNLPFTLYPLTFNQEVLHSVTLLVARKQGFPDSVGIYSRKIQEIS